MNANRFAMFWKDALAYRLQFARQYAREGERALAVLAYRSAEDAGRVLRRICEGAPL